MASLYSNGGTEYYISPKLFRTYFLSEEEYTNQKYKALKDAFENFVSLDNVESYKITGDMLDYNTYQSNELNQAYHKEVGDFLKDKPFFMYFQSEHMIKVSEKTHIMLINLHLSMIQDQAYNTKKGVEPTLETTLKIMQLTSALSYIESIRSKTDIDNIDERGILYTKDEDGDDMDMHGEAISFKGAERVSLVKEELKKYKHITPNIEITESNIEFGQAMLDAARLYNEFLEFMKKIERRNDLSSIVTEAVKEEMLKRCDNKDELEELTATIEALNLQRKEFSTDFLTEKMKSEVDNIISTQGEKFKESTKEAYEKLKGQKYQNMSDFLAALASVNIERIDGAPDLSADAEAIKQQIETDVPEGYEGYINAELVTNENWRKMLLKWQHLQAVANLVNRHDTNGWAGNDKWTAESKETYKLLIKSIDHSSTFGNDDTISEILGYKIDVADPNPDPEPDGDITDANIKKINNTSEYLNNITAGNSTSLKTATNLEGLKTKTRVLVANIVNEKLVPNNVKYNNVIVGTVKQYNHTFIILIAIHDGGNPVFDSIPDGMGDILAGRAEKDKAFAKINYLGKPPPSISPDNAVIYYARYIKFTDSHPLEVEGNCYWGVLNNEWTTDEDHTMLQFDTRKPTNDLSPDTSPMGARMRPSKARRAVVRPPLRRAAVRPLTRTRGPRELLL